MGKAYALPLLILGSGPAEQVEYPLPVLVANAAAVILHLYVNGAPAVRA